MFGASLMDSAAGSAMQIGMQLANKFLFAGPNQQAISDIEQQISQAASPQEDYDNIEDLQNNWGAGMLTGVDYSKIGHDTLFNHGASKAKARLRNSVERVNNLNLSNKLANANNLQLDQNLSALYGMAYGGELGAHGSSFTNGMITVNNGGTHEQNPNGGVPMGMDNQGVPDLVEQKEAVYDREVYSDRLKVPQKLVKKYKFGGKKGKQVSFADAAKEAAKESEERPLDPISKNGLDAVMAELKDSQDEVRLRKQFRELRKQLDEMSPEEQVQFMQQLQGQQQLAQEQMQDPAQQGISQEGMPQEAVPQDQMAMMQNPMAMMSAYGGRLHADGDGLSYPTISKVTKPLSVINDPAKAINNVLGLPSYTRQQTDVISSLNKAKPINVYTGTSNRSSDNFGDKLVKAGKWAPLALNGISVITDALGWTNNSSTSNAIKNYITRSSNNTRNIQPDKIGGYKAVPILDYGQMANNQRSATQAAINSSMDLANGNRGAALVGLYSLNNAGQQQWSDTYLKGLQQQAEFDMNVAKHNLGIDAANIQAQQEADKANAQMALQNREINSRALSEWAKYASIEDAARGSNVNNFAQSLAQLEEDKFNRTSLDSLLKIQALTNLPELRKYLNI